MTIDRGGTVTSIGAPKSNMSMVMFIEPSPAPAKYGASLLRKCEDIVRLPLLSCTDGAKTQIRSAMTQVGLL